jgi:hypothetical protein
MKSAKNLVLSAVLVGVLSAGVQAGEIGTPGIRSMTPGNPSCASTTDPNASDLTTTTDSSSDPNSLTILEIVLTLLAAI